MAETIAYSYFDDVAASTIHRGAEPWSAIVQRIENVKPVPSKAACGLIKLAEFGDVRSSGNSLRNNQNVLRISGIEGDYDAGEVSPEEAKRRLEQHRIRGVVYTSPSHTEDKPRWRVLAPLSRPHLPADRRLLMARLNGALGGILAPESFTLSQSYYIGRIEGSTYKTLHAFDDPEDGTPIDQLDGLDAIAVYPVKDSIHAAPGEDGPAIGAGSRNRTLTSMAGKLRRDGLTPAELEAALLAVNRERCTPPLSDDEVRSIARSVGRYAPGASADSPVINRGESALALLARDMPPIHYLNRPWISEGLCIVASRPKLGKTTLFRQIAGAVSEGSELFGERCKQATVLFLQLEEGDRLNREKLDRGDFSMEALRHVYFHYECTRGEQGAAWIDAYLRQYTDVQLVLIDSLTRFRSIPDKNLPAFMADYEAVRHLHAVAKAHPGLAIKVAHHTRKCSSDDPIDDISGTYGLTAACDSYWVMRRHNEGIALHVGGRLWDREEAEYGLIKGGQRLTLQQAFSGLSASQTETLRIVKERSVMRPAELAEVLGITRQSSRDRLQALLAQGYLQRVRGVHGAYECTR